MPSPITRRPRRSLRLGMVAAGVAVVLGVAACSDGPTDTAAPTTATTPTTVAAPAGTPGAVSSEALLDAVTATVLGQSVVYPSGQAQVSSGIVTIPPGARTGMHTHSAPMYAYVLEGTVTISYETGEVKEFGPGTAIIEAVGTPHEGANLGTVPVRILTVNIGAEGVANTTRL